MRYPLRTVRSLAPGIRSSWIPLFLRPPGASLIARPPKRRFGAAWRLY